MAIATRGQFNIYQPASGLKIDVMLPRDDDFNRSRFRRRLRVQPAADLDAWFASPEDAILKKLQYYQEGGSEKHLRDIASMIKVSGGRMDFAYIEHWTQELGVAEIWQTLLKSTG